jgi:hypothetical protein
MSEGVRAGSKVGSAAAGVGLLGVKNGDGPERRKSRVRVSFVLEKHFLFSLFCFY